MKKITASSNSTSIVPINAFKDNYIWTILSDNKKTAWVVDPGDVVPVMKYFQNNNLTLSGILLTHHHVDHSGGINKLIKQVGNIPVIASHTSKIDHITQRVKEGDEITCGQLHLKVLEIPGHTLDHIAFYNDEILFSGDTLFSAGCGKVFEGTQEQMFDSLSKLLKLPSNIKIYCGHEYTLQNLLFAQHVEPGNEHIKNKLDAINKLIEKHEPTLPSTLKDEKLYNPFLRCKEPSVIEAVTINAGQPLKGPVDVFMHLRHWKNGYR